MSLSQVEKDQTDTGLNNFIRDEQKRQQSQSITIDLDDTTPMGGVTPKFDSTKKDITVTVSDTEKDQVDGVTPGEEKGQEDTQMAPPETEKDKVNESP